MGCSILINMDFADLILHPILIEVVNDWAEALEHCDSCHCLFLDFAKAFDSVTHATFVTYTGEYWYLWFITEMVQLFSDFSLSVCCYQWEILKLASSPIRCSSGFNFGSTLLHYLH